jgi:hypothetical protein
VSPACVVNALIPFRTRLADDGLVHLRAWTTAAGPIAVVAEMDWAILIDDPAEAYYGPGIFTYPHYAIPAALDACRAAGVDAPRLIVRLPAPPGERFAEVTDPEDPQGWRPIEPADIAALVGVDQWPGPAVGAYTRRVVQDWIANGTLPIR